MERGGIWRLVNGGHGAAFEQARSNQVGKTQGEQARPAVAGGDAQQQVGDHGGKNLQANGVSGTGKPRKLRILRCCLIHRNNSSICQRLR